MKVTDLRRKLAATLAAGGMLVPSLAPAANLDANLVVNAGFEDLKAEDPDINSLLNWTDGSTLGFTYASGEYDNGGPLSGGGSSYFTANGGSDPREPGQVAQRIDLSTGPSATLIAGGTAQYQLTGIFTTYLADNDFGFLQVDFLNNSGVQLGSSGVVSPGENLQTWTPLGVGGAIPVGSATALVSVYGGGTSGGPDGYIDNVDFRVTNNVALPTLDIRVNRSDGRLTLSNRTGGPINLSGYQITSAFEGLDPSKWTSIADNYDANEGGPVDLTNEWSKLTKASARGDLSEADLDSGAGTSLGNNQVVNLGNANAWIKNPNEDLIFRYVSGGELKKGVVIFEGGQPYAQGDLDVDGDIDAGDWALLRGNQHSDLSSLSLAEAYRRGDLTGDLKNDFPDFVAFKGLYDAANGTGAFAATLASVPEPTSLALVIAGLLLCGPTSRRRAPE